ncbi:DEAD/DEAH box helicase [Gorillibacterium sp. CAU 1737]|uniref:DEAD/DEAH box helicase n=1 Tax=Gorillibacterium sp. CAU 1737 TaxID=3140362 RepID=UPI003260C497
MSAKLTKKSIREWCGPAAYQKGEQLVRSHHVHLLHSDLPSHHYTAEVTGTSRQEVKLAFDWTGKPEAVCSCPSLGSVNSFCHHIAAVLLYVHNLLAASPSTLSALPVKRSTEEVLPMVQAGIAERILGLFEDKPLRPMHNRTLPETRAYLQAEFVLTLIPFDPHTSLFGLELRIGPKALYVVKNIYSFLDQLTRGESYPLSSRFRYEPELHSFERENEAVLTELSELARNYAAASSLPSGHARGASVRDNPRRLLIPAHAWTKLLPLLRKAPLVTVMEGSTKYSGLSLSEELLPLRFEFDQENAGGYLLHVHGLEPLTVMEPYEAVFLQGSLTALSSEQCKRIAELKAILDKSGLQSIPLDRSQLTSFMGRVPLLRKLGQVVMAPAVASQVTRQPLQAKLYLDRVRDRLLASVEFQYGPVVLNPLEEGGAAREAHGILVRDVDQERLILDKIEQSPFTRTEAGYFLNEEEEEFEFLYTVVPELEKWMKVYATTAVKLRVHKLDQMPKVSVQASADERMKWLEFRLNMGWIPETEIRGLVKAIEEKRRYYRLPNHSLLPLDGSEFQELANFLKDTGLLYSDLEGSSIHVPFASGLAMLESDSGAVKLDRPLRQLLHNLKNPDNLDFPIPASLTNVLRDYQKVGYQWFKTLAHYGFGGILADDMGLGKTLQSIAYIASLLPEIREQRKPVLVISPGSLVYNWRNELSKFSPDIRVLIADGSPEERTKKMQGLTEADVVLTSYPLLLRDLKLYIKQPFHTLLLDEAQAFKNHATQTAQAVKRIRADYRFALTGTPVENRLEELWSIFHVVFPTLFPDRTAFGTLSSQEVAKRARPFMLRRWKQEVLQDLPDKVESLKLTELLPEQKKLYVAYLAKLQEETLKHLDEEGYSKNRIKILAGLTRLRQICCHPALFVKDYKGGSAKLDELMEIVEECLANRKRLLLFSQFTEMLGLIRERLNERGLPHFYLDGSTPVRERVDLCSRFNEGEMEIFLISLKAGGTGLNLTGADTVILYDLWWNPAVEQQATDRAHRMGQKNVVQVIRMVSRDTMEEKMYQLQQKKKHLIDEVIGPEQEQPASLTEQELREILMI